MVKMVAEDPLVLLDSIKQLIRLLRDLGILDDIIAQLPEAIHEKQELNNPYDPQDQPGLYNRYEEGWYGGYVSYFVVEAVVGASAVKAAKSSSRLAKVVDSVPDGGKLTTFAKYASRANRVAGGKRVFGVAKTTGARIRVARQLRKIDGDDVDSLSPAQQTRLGRLLARSDSSGREMTDGSGDIPDDFKRTLLHSDPAEFGVEPDQWLEVQKSVLDAVEDGALKKNQVPELVEDLKAVKGLDGDKYRCL